MEKKSYNLGTSFPDLTDGILLKSKIYIMGGANPTCKNTYEVSIDTNFKLVTPKKDMLLAKYFHSLCKYD